MTARTASVKSLPFLLLIYAALFLAGSVLFVFSFHTPLFAGIDVFFYRGLVLILFWGVVLAAAMLALRAFLNRSGAASPAGAAKGRENAAPSRWKGLITVRDVLLLFTAFCCVQTVLFTHLPVTADRSISVFMLGHFADNPDRDFTETEIEDFFIQRYVKDYGAFSKRFHEQEETGTIARDKNGDGWRITENGKRLMKLYEQIARWFALDEKLIHPDG